MRKILNFPTNYKKIYQDSCGPVAMRQIIHHKLGIEIPERDLMNIAHTSRKGTFLPQMEKVAKEFNLNYFIKTNSSIEDLIDSINKGNPIILSVQAWPNKKVKSWGNIWHLGHYDDFFGYDNKLKKLVYYDTFDGKVKDISFGKLNEVWHDINFKTGEIYNHLGMFFDN